MGSPPARRPTADEQKTTDLASMYDAQVRDVFGFVYRRCGDRSLAEEITQEVFVRLARYHNEHDRLPPAAWLYQVARNCLIDSWRSQAMRERRLALVHSDARRDAPDPADEVVSGDQVLAALGQLPASQRAVLVLRYVDGLPVAEVAAGIGKSVKATESLLARARRRLLSSFEGRA